MNTDAQPNGTPTFVRGTQFYNTNSTKGAELVASWAQIAKQDAEVLAVFMDNLSPTRMAPHHVWRLLQRKYPLTSIRRAICNLTNGEYLVKTNTMVLGLYGRDVHTWELKGEENGK